MAIGEKKTALMCWDIGAPDGVVPAGYGYGEVLRLGTTTDADGTVFEAMLDEQLAGMKSGETKQYAFTDYPVLSGYDGFLTLNKRSDTWASVVAHFALPGGTVTTVTKAYVNGTWYPWSLANPPVVLGKEYRTSELYLDRPVYVKTILMQNCTNGVRQEAATGVNGVIRCQAVSSNLGGTYPDIRPRAMESSVNFRASYANSADGTTTAAWIDCYGGTGVTAFNAYVTVWYTKAA